MRRTIIIGDIHGCYDELILLLEKLSIGSTDRVVAVGDLTVKGPKSVEVVELFRREPRFSSVIGNHDLALVRYWKGENIALKKSQRAAFDTLSGHPECLNYLQSLPFKIDLTTHVVVHAGVRPGVPLGRQSTADLTELRTLGGDRRSREGLPWYEAYNDPKIVLFGHWPSPRPRRGKFAIGLDTGCVYGYALTAYVIENGEFYSVEAQRAYTIPTAKGEALSVETSAPDGAQAR